MSNSLRRIWRILPEPVKEIFRSARYSAIRLKFGGYIKIPLAGRSFGVFHNSFAEFQAARTFLTFEPEFLNAFIEASENSDVVYDIGGYIGLYSLTAASCNSSAKVFCFEAQEENYASINRNAECNQYESVKVFQTVLGDIEATRVNFTRTGETGRVASASDEDSDGEACVSTTLDAFVASQDIPGPDLVKIDVEGYEAHVLRGMSDTLTRFKPTVLVEVHPELLEMHGESSDEVDRLMASQGYSKKLLRGPGIGKGTSHLQWHIAYQHPEKWAV